MRYAERWKYLGMAILAVVFIPLWSGCWPDKDTGASNLPGNSGKKNTESKGSGEAPGSDGLSDRAEQTAIILYFSNSDGYLVAEKRTVTKVEGIARLALQELIKGPAPGSQLRPTIPQGTILRDIGIKNGLATVDFSKEIRLNHGGGSCGELLTVYSIINTLTQFPAVQQVQILLDGQKEETLMGHIDLTRPMPRDESLVRTANESPAR